MVFYEEYHGIVISALEEIFHGNCIGFLIVGAKVIIIKWIQNHILLP
jgi:hypothetical protein